LKAGRAAAFWIIVVLGAAAAEPSQAQVLLSFHGHEGGQVRGGWVYFPHAYVQLKGRLSTGEAVDQAYGFTALAPGPWLLAFRGRGRLAEPDGRYAADARNYGVIELSDSAYRDVLDRLEHWRSEQGSVYDLRRRNCITFVADIARTVGLVTPDRSTLSPNAFLVELAGLNPSLSPEISTIEGEDLATSSPDGSVPDAF
jgi:hypothetical protein